MDVLLIASINIFLCFNLTFSSNVITSLHPYSFPVSGSTVKSVVFPTQERNPFIRL